MTDEPPTDDAVTIHIKEGEKRARVGVEVLSLLQDGSVFKVRACTHEDVHFRDHVGRSFSRVRV